MRGNSQNGGQTTKSLLTKPQCSGVPIQQAVSLSSSFPRHCLLFVCAFFPETPESARSEELPLLPPPAYKTAPASITETGAVRLLYGYFFQALAQNLARGLLVSPAYAGKSSPSCRGSWRCRDHPRACGEKICCCVYPRNNIGSPLRMRGKGAVAPHRRGRDGITLAYVCGEKTKKVP